MYELISNYKFYFIGRNIILDIESPQQIFLRFVESHICNSIKYDIIYVIRHDAYYFFPSFFFPLLLTLPVFLFALAFFIVFFSFFYFDLETISTVTLTLS